MPAAAHGGGTERRQMVRIHPPWQAPGHPNQQTFFGGRQEASVDPRFSWICWHVSSTSNAKMGPERLTMILETGRVAPFHKNGYVIGCEETREGVLIDPGDEVDQLLDAVRRTRYRFATSCSRTRIWTTLPGSDARSRHWACRSACTGPTTSSTSCRSAGRCLRLSGRAAAASRLLL